MDAKSWRLWSKVATWVFRRAKGQIMVILELTVDRRSFRIRMIRKTRRPKIIRLWVNLAWKMTPISWETHRALEVTQTSLYKERRVTLTKWSARVPRMRRVITVRTMEPIICFRYAETERDKGRRFIQILNTCRRVLYKNLLRMETSRLIPQSCSQSLKWSKGCITEIH